MEIQPRSFGDSLTDVIANLGKVWRVLAGPAIVASAVMGILTIVAFESTDSFDVFEVIFNNPEAFEVMSDEELVDTLTQLGTGAMIVSLFSSVVYGFVYLTAAIAVGRAHSTRHGTPVVTVAFRLFPIWLIAAIVAGIGIFAGLFLLILPGVWLAMMLSMYTPVIALEGRGPVDSLRRSFELVKDNFWETLGFILLIGLIGVTAGQLFQLVAIPILMSGQASFGFGLAFAVGVVGQGLILAAIAVGMSTWYLNLRARTDGAYLIEGSQ
ncbi:MAG TPA: hypothetical protein VMO52_06830 [Acidimicrobiia bacterium]|nr:hypothetical protein [Acidimicrobiia bacterium]